MTVQPNTFDKDGRVLTIFLLPRLPIWTNAETAAGFFFSRDPLPSIIISPTSFAPPPPSPCLLAPRCPPRPSGRRRGACSGPSLPPWIPQYGQTCIVQILEDEGGVYPPLPLRDYFPYPKGAERRFRPRPGERGSQTTTPPPSHTSLGTGRPPPHPHGNPGHRGGHPPDGARPPPDPSRHLPEVFHLQTNHSLILSLYLILISCVD